MDKMAYCGLEVSARELVVAMEETPGKTRLRRFANNAIGHRALLRVLRGAGKVRVVLEATGLYGLDVALALSGQEGVEVMVANPRAVRNFAQATMQRSKNDQLDSVVLREFAARMPFRKWARPTENALALWAMARRLEALTAQRAAEKNRRHAAQLSQAVPALVRREIVNSLRFLERSIVRHGLDWCRLVRRQQRFPSWIAATIDRALRGVGSYGGYGAVHAEKRRRSTPNSTQ
jgi:transposase